MTPLDPRSRAVAAGTLLLARAVYAYNWYNIGAVLPLLETQFGIGTAQLGIVLGAFLAGAAIFQVPAGLVALRWGNRTTSVVALGVMGAFCLASAGAPNWVVLAGLRFGAGAGAAFFFAPALGLVASYYPVGTRGPVIGLYNAGFSLGSGVALIASAYVGETLGWSAALGLGGALLIAAVAPALLLLPSTESRPSARGVGALWRSVRPVFRSRPVWALALGTTGLWAGYYVAAQYFVAYAKVANPTWSLTLAAAIPTVMILAEVVGGPIGGWFGEKARDMRSILLYWGLASAGVLVVVPFLSFDLVWPAFAFLGFAAGVVFAVIYLIPTYLPELSSGAYPLGLALLNSVQIFTGTAAAIAFGLVAASVGYTTAWWFAGALSVGFLPFLILVVVARRTPTVSGPGPA